MQPLLFLKFIHFTPIKLQVKVKLMTIVLYDYYQSISLLLQLFKLMSHIQDKNSYDCQKPAK